MWLWYLCVAIAFVSAIFLIQDAHMFLLSPGWEGPLSLKANRWPVSVCGYPFQAGLA